VVVGVAGGGETVAVFVPTAAPIAEVMDCAGVGTCVGVEVYNPEGAFARTLAVTF
jgi:hypothetical protein